MGLKFELLLVVLIVLTSAVTMTTKLHEHNSKTASDSKELEFTDTTFTEVTPQKRVGVSFAAHGVRAGGILKVEHLRYYNDTIKELLADRGTYRENLIYLDGNVSLRQTAGFDYYTQHAYYDKKYEVLYVPSPFTAYRGEDVMHGATLRYNTKSKEAYATMIDAVLHTAETNETNETKE